MKTLTPLDPTLPLAFQNISTREYVYQSARLTIKHRWHTRHDDPATYRLLRGWDLREIAAARTRWLEDTVESTHPPGGTA